MNPDPKSCIFCESNGVTKEHVFPNWMKKIFQRDETTTHTFGVVDKSELHGIPRLTEVGKQGHAGTRKVRVVCSNCNNGWLSQLEDDAKGVLEPVIQGQKIGLGLEQQKLLATWLAKSAMTAEFVRPRRDGVTQAERRYLMENKEPPANWIVWLAGYEGGDWSELGMGQSRGNLQSTPYRIIGQPTEYAQATIFGLGNAIGLVVSASVDEIANRFAELEWDHVLRIWPPKPRSILWPLTGSVKDEDVNALMNILQQSGILDNSLNPLGDYRLGI